MGKGLYVAAAEERGNGPSLSDEPLIVVPRLKIVLPERPPLIIIGGEEEPRDPFTRWRADKRRCDRFNASNLENLARINAVIAGANGRAEMHVIGPQIGEEDFVTTMTTPVQYSGGSGSFSGASVRDENGETNVVASSPTNGVSIVHSTARNEPNYVLKENADARQTDIEARLYDAFRERGIRTPRVVRVEGKQLVMEKSPGRCLDTYLSQDSIPLGLEGQADHIAKFFKMNSLMHYVASVAAKIDAETGKILTDEDEVYLHEKTMASLVRFGDRQEVERRYHTYRILDAADLGEAFAGLFQPVEELLQKGMQKYGTWIGGVYPKNILVDDCTGRAIEDKFMAMDPTAREELVQLIQAQNMETIIARPDVREIEDIIRSGLLDHVTFIDFNHPDYTHLQTTDSFMWDAYMPMRHGNYRVKSLKVGEGRVWQAQANEDERPDAGKGEFALCSLVMEKEAQEMTGYRAKCWNDVNPEKPITDLDDYGKHYMAARVVRNLRQFGHHLQTARRNEEANGTYQAMYDGVMAAYHHLGLAHLSLNYLIRSGDATPELRDHVYRQGNRLIRDAVPEGEWQDCIAWMNL